MKKNKIYVMPLLLAVLIFSGGCDRKDTSEKTTAEPDNFYVIKNEVTLPYEISWSDNIRCTEDTIYVGGYSGMTDIGYVFSVYDTVSDTLKHIDSPGNSKGDVTAVYLGKDEIYAAYSKENRSWFVVCDADTGKEIVKVDTETGKRISAFFEDENGRLIAEFTGNTNRPEVVSYSEDYSSSEPVPVFENIPDGNVVISDLFYNSGCYYVLTSEDTADDQKLSIFAVSEDGNIVRSFYDVMADTKGRYEAAYLNSRGNLCISVRDETNMMHRCIDEIGLTDGSVVNRYDDDFGEERIYVPDRAGENIDFFFTDGDILYKYSADESQKTVFSLDEKNGRLACVSGNDNKFLLCSAVYASSEIPVIYKYDTDGNQTGVINAPDSGDEVTVLQADVLSYGNAVFLSKDGNGNYAVLWTDKDGKIINQTEVLENTGAEKATLWAGNNSELYVLGYTDDETVYSYSVFDRNAAKIREGSGKCPDGRIKEMFFMNGSDFILFENADWEKRIICTDEKISFDDFVYPEYGIEKVFSLSDGSVCYFDTDSVYRTDADGFSGRKLLNWNDCGVIPLVNAVGVMNDDTVVCLTSGNGYTFTVLERADDALAEKLRNQKVLTIGGVGISSGNLTELFEEFGNENQEYRLCVSDYMKYSTGDPQESIDKLNLDIAAGKTPDILIGSYDLDLEFYAERGLFCDLNEFMESDAEINRSDFLENIFDCFVTDGRQMYVPVNFDIYAFYGKESDLGSGNGWTTDEFLEFAGKKDMFFNTSRSMMMQSLVYADLSSFVDRENKKCSFNDGRFEKILEYIFENGVPDENYKRYDSYPAGSTEYKDYFRRFSDGLCLTEYAGISGLSSLASFKNGDLNGENIVLKGVPSDDKSGPLVYARMTAGISSSSENREAAWKLVKKLLSDDYQTKVTSSASFPVRTSVFDSAVKNSRRKGFGYKTDGTFYETNPLSDEDVNEFINIVKSVNEAYSSDSRIKSIIDESAGEYFNGSLTAKEASEKIQNKVTLYLNEIK
ncbi:MAG: extracellular solute-binding protein [Oscillospiraceae bacterium]|nr:extracellular solute-binding protein [Oscillospiraceae bacterium]